MLQSQSQWMNASMPTTMSKDIDKYLCIEQPSTFGKDESGNNVIKAEKFDFDLFSNSCGVFELEQWILTNQSRSCDPTKCISDYLTNEAVDEQFKSKLARLNQLKARTEKLDQDMKKERLKKLNDINKKMRYCMHEEEPFVAYEDITDISALRRRSRGLTYEENIELMKYQKRSGIHIKQSQPTQPNNYPTLPTQSIGNPTTTISTPSQYNTTTIPAPCPPAYSGYPQMPQANLTTGGMASGYPSGSPPQTGYPQPAQQKTEKLSDIICKVLKLK